MPVGRPVLHNLTKNKDLKNNVISHDFFNVMDFLHDFNDYRIEF